MVRPTYDHLREFFRSPTSRLGAALPSLRKTNPLLLPRRISPDKLRLELRQRRTTTAPTTES
jgi:hypothetical protein